MPGKSKRRGGSQATREFAVIGLGRFGATLARRLEAIGHTVLGVDIDAARVQEIADDITSAAVLDAINEEALQEVDIASFGTVIVGIDEDFEASALITAHLKNLGIGRVICIAKTRRHQDILVRIGADQVIVPDEDSGRRLAETLARPDLLERVLLDADHSLAELRTPSGLAGQPISVFNRTGIAVLLIQRGHELIPCPGADRALEDDDTLFVIGERDRLLEVAALT